MWYKEEDDFHSRQDREKVNRHVKIELPPPFSGDEKQSFLCWTRQFEVAVRAITEGDSAASVNYELVRILPTRFAGAAFLLWDSLPATVQGDYNTVKEKLKEAFGQRQFMDRFRASLSARPRAPRESLEVYAAEVSRLVDEAFPEYGDKAQREEKFRRFLAGLDPVLRAKCHEQGATDLEEAVIIAGRCENARNSIKTDYMPVNAAYGNSEGGAVAAVHSVTDNGGLYRAVDRLTEEMRDMRMELMRLGDKNQRLKARASPRAMDEWSGDRSQSSGMCQCVCGGRGCQSRVFAARRGRSPERKSFQQHDEHTSADITAATVSSVAPPVSLDESPISESERAALSALLLEYSDIFSSSKRNSGRCTLVKHHIRTGEQTPIKQRAYLASPEKRAEIEKQVAGLLADGVIEESCSPWASPVVLVKKKCGTWRFCVDYRRLNSVTIKDSHPLPRVDDTLDALAGAVWFSTLDFSNGYWQVEVAEDDREKTAFTTGQGLYQWRSMPMGLSNAPATFQRLMELVFRGLPWHICMVYLDDILIYSKTFEEHLSSLKEVFLRIQSAGLKLNPSKCHLARDHVVFLGHVVSRKGLQPDPKNTEKVLNWPIPRSPSEVRAFVGLCSYYRRVAFKIYMDASNLAVGAVLAQDRDGLEHVVTYASWALNSTQKRWSTFDHHRPLLAIRRLSIDDDPTGRRGRWILELDPLNWVIVHKDGKQHKNSDALSRRPDTPSPSEAEASVGESAQTVARCLFEDYVLIHGVPETLHSDQGRQFEAEVVPNLCHLLNIKKTRTTSYHPKKHGFPLMYSLPTRALDSQMSASHAEFVSLLLTKLNSAFSSARMHGDAAHDRQKLYHDAGLRHQPYYVGAMVWLHNPVESRMKLAPHWKGPYRIAQVMDSCGEQGLTYRIKNPFDSGERAQIVHYNRLRPYTLPVSPRSQNKTLSNARDSQPESLSLESGVSGGE
ncbi:hypothetical protein QTP86_014757, partial [Hemibagrus guttatus]